MSVVRDPAVSPCATIRIGEDEAAARSGEQVPETRDKCSAFWSLVQFQWTIRPRKPT